jgi:hypothetical protein
MPPAADSLLTPVFAECAGDTCSCACDDPFDPRIRVPEGDFTGKCLNTCRQRSVLILRTDQQNQYGYFSDSMVQAAGASLTLVNVSHADSVTGERLFCAALIPLAGVRDVLVNIEFSGGPRAHSQLRFRFGPESPVVLVPQRTGVPRRVWLERDLVFTAEALAPPGTAYKADYAMRGQYYQCFRFETLYPRADRMIRDLRRPVGQVRLDIQPDQATRVLLAAAGIADSLQYSVKYHTTTRNCVLEVFTAIDRGVGVSWWRRPLLLLTNRTLFAPLRTPRHLRYRSLAARRQQDFVHPNLEAELGWEQWVDSALVQELAQKSAQW